MTRTSTAAQTATPLIAGLDVVEPGVAQASRRAATSERICVPGGAEVPG